MAYDPAGVVEDVLMLKVLEQFGEQDVGEKKAVAPAGRPEMTESDTGEGVPDKRLAVMVFDPNCP